MRVVPDFSRIPAFEIIEPTVSALPLLLSSPHSGDCYPSDFLAASRLDATRIRRSEDAFVDRLFAAAPGVGAAMIKANFPRAFLDVNREPYELDPRMFVGRLPAHANIRSLRVSGGLGTIARVVAENEEIYRHPMPVEAALDRISRFYFPFHEALGRRLSAINARHGWAVLLDCHSMPSGLRAGESARRLDIVVGDRYGASADAHLIQAALDLFADLGFAVQRNKPYAGGYITERYGRPNDGLHVLQIEVNRGLYMDEARHEPLPGFAAVASRLTRFLAGFAAVLGDLQPPDVLAAE